MNIHYPSIDTDLEYVLLTLVIDFSGSTKVFLGKSRICELIIRAVKEVVSTLQSNEYLRDHVLLNIIGFGNGKVEMLLQPTMINGLSIDELDPLFPEPQGSTPFNKAMKTAILTADDIRKHYELQGACIAKPIISCLTDAEIILDNELIQMVDERLTGCHPQDDKQILPEGEKLPGHPKLVLIPYGIGNGDYAPLKRLIEKDMSHEAGVVTKPEDFLQYVRILKMTTVQVAQIYAGNNPRL